MGSFGYRNALRGTSGRYQSLRNAANSGSYRTRKASSASSSRSSGS